MQLSYVALAAAILFNCAFGSPSFSADAIENWRFTWTLYESKEATVLIDASEDGTLYRVKGPLSSLSFTADEANGIGSYLSKILSMPEEESAEGKHIVGRRVVDIKRKDGVLRFMLGEDSDFSMSMSFFNVREIKKVALAFDKVPERIKLVNERMRVAVAAP